MALKCSKNFWKSQLQIFIANSIPFVGTIILELVVESLFKKSYDSLEKPRWAPNYKVTIFIR
jgi:tryptophan-rich sensory protein